jgi:DNA-binding IclR family transcriptional regulator
VTKGKKKRLPQGVQGVEIGARVLLALARAQAPLALNQLARASELQPSKAHRYVVSLCRAGLLEQDPRSGRYDLGPAALHVGLAAQYRLDEVRLADQAVEELHEATGLTVGLAVWGDHGPTVLRRKEGPAAVTVSRRIGSTMSLLGTNAGRVFAAFLPRQKTATLFASEFARGAAPIDKRRRLTRRGFEQLLATVRRNGWSATQGGSFVGLDSVAFPIFDHAGTVCMTLSIMGAHGTVDLSTDGRAFKEVRRSANWLSERLGNPRSREA